MRRTTCLMAGTIMFGSAVAGVGIGSAGASTPAPGPKFTCAGTLSAPESIPAGTYSALMVPAGSICVIPGPGAVNVLSSVLVGRGGGLIMTGPGDLKIVGNVTVADGGAFAAALKSEKKTSVSILGSVSVRNDGAFYLGTEVPHGPVFANIQGSVQGLSPSAVVIQNVAIGGSATVRGGGALNAVVEAFTHNSPFSNYTDFEDDQVTGSVTEVGYGGIWGGVIRTIIGHAFTFAYNSQSTIDEYDIGSDIIFGSAFCAGNDPTPNTGQSTGAPSLVYGTTFGDQAATCTGVPGGGTGPVG